MLAGWCHVHHAFEIFVIRHCSEWLPKHFEPSQLKLKIPCSWLLCYCVLPYPTCPAWSVLLALPLLKCAIFFLCPPKLLYISLQYFLHIMNHFRHPSHLSDWVDNLALQSSSKGEKEITLAYAKLKSKRRHCLKRSWLEGEIIHQQNAWSEIDILVQQNSYASALRTTCIPWNFC